MRQKPQPRGGPPAPEKKQARWPLIIAATGAAVLLLGVVLLARPAPRASSGDVGPAAGAPRLAVDQERLDFGETRFNTPIKATFRLSNTGDAPLRILGQPMVAVLEGC